MGDVTDLKSFHKKREEYVFQCLCGGQHFYLNVDGSVECRSCDRIVQRIEWNYRTAKEPACMIWDQVYAEIDEIEWFVSRKKDLAALTEKGDRTWADILAADIQGLRDALALVRAVNDGGRTQNRPFPQA